MPSPPVVPGTNLKERSRWLGTATFGLALLGALGLLVLLALILQVEDVRGWLETWGGLTFPSPLAGPFWNWLALAPILLLLLYFLKLRRRPLEVSSTLLWRKSTEDLHVNSLIQWLRRNLLLIVQLLVLGAVGYALAAPTTHQEEQGRHFIFLLDNSASMAATDVKPSRLEEAKRRLREHIRAMAESDHGMLIAFNSEAATVQSFTHRKPDLLAAVDRVPQTQRPTRIDQALAIAEGQANPRRSAIEGSVEEVVPGQAPRSLLMPEGLNAEAIIFSDGRFPDLPQFSAGRLRLRLELVGTLPTPAQPSGPRNIGITMASLRRDEVRLDRYTLDVRVQSFLAERLANSVSLQVELFTPPSLADRQIKPLDFAPRSQTPTPQDTETIKYGAIVPGSNLPNPIETFSLIDVGTGWVRITLLNRQTGQPWEDDLAVDNQVWLAIAPVRRARVLRIGLPNDILDAFLRASTARQRLAVSVLPPANFEAHPTYVEATKAETFDLVIFDRVQPQSPEMMPEANAFFIGSAPPWPGGGFDDLPWLSNLFVKEFRSAHPLLRGIETLQGMTIQRAKGLPEAARQRRASALIETQSVPVLWALGRGRYTDLVLTFPLIVEGTWNTNWPKQPAGTLPLFLDNVVTQLGRFQEVEESSRPGQPKPLAPGRPVAAVRIEQVEPRSGPAVDLQPAPGRELVWNSPENVGLFAVEWGESEPFRFAVNLFDADESCIVPRPAALLGEEQVGAAAEPLRFPREFWPWLVLAALALALLEWTLYLRRGAV